MMPFFPNPSVNMAPTQSVVRNKSDKIKKTPPAAQSSTAAAAAAVPGVTGPATLDASRDAWANALSQMGQVRATNPLTAIAQVAGMGLAGYGQGKAVKQKEANTVASRQRMADILSGKPTSSQLMQAMADPYADESTQRMLMQMWERQNPTVEQQLQRQNLQLQMEGERARIAQSQTEQQQQSTEWKQKQDEYQRQLALRNGRADAVQQFDDRFKQQGGDLFSPEMQMFNRQNGIQGVDPRDTIKHQQMEPYVNAGDYEHAFENMVTPPDKGDFIESNGALYNTRTGQWVQNPTGSGATDDLKEYNAAVQQGYTGTFRDYMTEMKRAGASQTNLYPGETAYSRKRGEDFAAQAGEIDKKATAAVTTLNTLDAMGQAMLDPRFYSGAGAETVLQLKRWVVAMGGDPDQVSSMETFQAQAKQLALARMGGSLGAGFSNADRDFVKGQVLSLENTPQGNMALMEITRRLAHRDLEIQHMAQQYEAEHGRIDAQFNAQLAQWAEANPIFPESKFGRPQQKPVQSMSDEELNQYLNSPAGGQ